MDRWRQFVTCLKLRTKFLQNTIALLECAEILNIVKLHKPNIFQSSLTLWQHKSKKSLYFRQRMLPYGWEVNAYSIFFCRINSIFSLDYLVSFRKKFNYMF